MEVKTATKRDVRAFARAVIEAVMSGEVTNREALLAKKRALAGGCGLSAMPKNPDLLAHAAPDEAWCVNRVLGLKPAKTHSGIAAVSVMPHPRPCPGTCTYCPSSQLEDGRPTPKAYTGFEPATMRALQHDYDPTGQIQSRITQFEQMGHSAEKIELIVMGGTFLSYPKVEKESFMKACLEAVSEKKAGTLEEARLACESSRHRPVGITFETRPDWCSEEQVREVLSYGGTRVELGVQILDDAVYEGIKRGHTVQDVADATARLRDSALKVAYHVMPGLPGADEKKDLRAFERMFSDPAFRPDMLKMYPCLAMPNTPLFEEFKRGAFAPLSSDEASERVAKMKERIPPYVRVMRVQRDIPTNRIGGGVAHSNLRQLARAHLVAQGKSCRCIRCREAGLSGARASQEDLKIGEIVYEASGGTEHFIQATDARDHVYGFCRLRFPNVPFVEELKGAALVRELHVYGTALALGTKSEASAQHAGLGKRLLERAEQIAREAGFEKVAVIAGLGVREYYRKLRYANDGYFVSKVL